MLKLLGSVCVLGGAVLALMGQLRERRRRQTALTDLIGAFRRMAEEVRLMRTPLPQLLEQSAKSLGEDAAAFFLTVSAALRRGENAAESWQRAAEALPLSDRDRSAVVSAGKFLKGDEESMCKGLSLVIYELAKSVEEAEKLRPDETKRTAALYLCGAAFLVILLL